MSMKRFEVILRAIRFDDYTTRPQRQATNRFAHISDLWDDVLKKCGENWVPGGVLTVDEQFCKFRGKCIFRMFIATKPGKYGIKIFMVCDADSLYCINGFPYLGKGTVEVRDLPRGINTNIYR